MQVSFVDNITQKLLPVLQAKLPQAVAAKFAVAFVNNSGLSLIEPCLQACLQKPGASVEFVVGLDFQMTEPAALKRLYQMSQSWPLSLFCFGDPFKEESSTYHPKLYLIEIQPETTAIVGSSNLTKGGLQDNVEVNIVIEAASSEEVISDIHSVYNRLKFVQPRIQPDEELIELYVSLHGNVHRKAKAVLQDSETRQLAEKLQQKASQLRRPRPTLQDLSGWQKLVFERLPPGPFTDADIYRYESEFQRHYPKNRHIREKIRQVLQQLRDLGLIRHLGQGMWERC